MENLTKSGYIVIQNIPVNGLMLSILTPLPYDKMLDCSKFKAYRDDKIN